MENGVIGYVYINDAINKNDKEMANVDDLTQHFFEGTILKPRIKNIDFARFRVDLTIKEQDLKIYKSFLEDLIPNWKYAEKSFLIKENEDFPRISEP